MLQLLKEAQLEVDSEVGRYRRIVETNSRQEKHLLLR